MQSVVGVAMVPEAILEKLEPMEGGAELNLNIALDWGG